VTKKLAALGVLALFAALVTIWFLWWSPGPKPGPHTIVVEEGSSLASVARQLETAGAIPGSARTFRTMARLLGSGDPVQAGEFEIPKNTSGAAVLNLLQHGQPVQRLITVTEGMPSIIVQEKLAAIRYLTGPAPFPPEGSVLPDSYGYKRGESRAAIVQRMQSAMTKTLDALWAKRKPTCPVNSKEEALILASIVEKETGKASDRAQIAGVFTNRLKVGMPLQTDPTVIYGLGAAFDGNLRKRDLQTDGPFNTYMRPGLPPTPIAMPGLASLKAAVNPERTKALYFVSRGDGSSVFSESLLDHNRAVNQYQRGGR
jgi:UPF0755 protein